MGTDPVSLYGAAYRALPGAASEASQTPVRVSRRGDVFSLPVGKALQNAAVEGSYFFACNPTPGTGIAGIAAADGYDALETLYLLSNTSTESEGVYVVPDFLELACTVVDTAGTTIRYDVHIDNVSRFTSGGSAITPVNCNMDSSTAAKATLRFGAVVSPAASASVRYLGGRLLSSTDLVANDTIRFEFGASSGAEAASINYSEEGTLARRWMIACPPAVLGPGDCLLLSINCASQSGAATWSFNTGWYER